MTMNKPHNQRDIQAAKAAEALRYQQRTAGDVRLFNNWQYMRMWRARNAAGSETSKAAS